MFGQINIKKIKKYKRLIFIAHLASLEENKTFQKINLAGELDCKNVLNVQCAL